MPFLRWAGSHPSCDAGTVSSMRWLVLRPAHCKLTSPKLSKGNEKRLLQALNTIYSSSDANKARYMHQRWPKMSLGTFACVGYVVQTTRNCHTGSCNMKKKYFFPVMERLEVKAKKPEEDIIERLHVRHLARHGERSDSAKNI